MTTRFDCLVKTLQDEKASRYPDPLRIVRLEKLVVLALRRVVRMHRERPKHRRFHL